MYPPLKKSFCEWSYCLRLMLGCLSSQGSISEFIVGVWSLCWYFKFNILTDFDIPKLSRMQIIIWYVSKGRKLTWIRSLWLNYCLLLFSGQCFINVELGWGIPSFELFYCMLMKLSYPLLNVHSYWLHSTKSRSFAGGFCMCQ